MSGTIGEVSSNSSREACEIAQALRTERAGYFRKKVICDAFASCELNSELRSKVDCVLMAHRLERCVSLGCGSVKLLTLDGLEQDKLSFAETETLRTAVGRKIVSTRDDVLKALGPLSKLKSTKIALKREVLHDFLKKLHFQQQMYVKNLLSLSNILNGMLSNRIDKMPGICEAKLLDAKLKDKMYSLRAKILDTRALEKVFAESPASLEAFQIARSDIKEAQKENKREIEEMQLLKEKFKQIKCAEFDEIAKSYVHYKRALHNMQQLYTKLNCK